MLANLSHYVTWALCEQLEAILASYVSELGNALPVAVGREYSDQPKIVPQVWLEARLPGPDAQQELIGDAAGVDASGNPLFGGIFDGLRVDFGCWARLAAERDNLIDYLWLALRYGVDPATNVRWAQDLYTRRGIELQSPVVTDAPAQPTSRSGQLYEGRGYVPVRTEVSASVIYQPVTTITVLPTSTVSVPLGLG